MVPEAEVELRAGAGVKANDVVVGGDAKKTTIERVSPIACDGDEMRIGVRAHAGVIHAGVITSARG